MHRIVFACFVAGFAACADAFAAEVTLLDNAQIRTLDEARPSAQAMAWGEDGRVLALGEGGALRERWPDARVIDAGSAHVVPGLIDAHGHVMGLGYSLIRADLVGTRSKAEAIERLRGFAKTLPKGTWLIGRGWDQNDWPDKAYPTAADLDAAFPDRPVWLRRVDGHAAWANTAAMRQAPRELEGDWQPEGGRILREGGRPTGVFVDGAMALVEDAIPPPNEAVREQALSRALAEAAKLGLTGVHDMGVSRADLALYRRFADAGRLTLRITAYADGDGPALEDLCANGIYRHGSGRLRMDGVKLYADGALGSRGAALLADYSDEAGNRGLLVTSPAALDAAIAKARRCGVQAAVHAIGDRGNRAVLDSFARHLPKARQNGAPGNDRRWRIEHAQVVALDDIPRFAALRVIASMQPTHATSDMPWAPARLGQARLAGAYAWRRFLDAKVPLALGSDFPVESPDPRLGLYAAITRQDREGRPPGGWLPDQRLTPIEALRGFTVDAAFAGFAEKEVGRLAPGYRADFVILDADPVTLPPAKIPALKIRATYLDGKPVYGVGAHPVRDRPEPGKTDRGERPRRRR